MNKELFINTNELQMIQFIEELVQASTPARVKYVVKEWVSVNSDIKGLLNIMYNPLIKFNYKLAYEDYTVDYSNLKGTDFAIVGEVLEALYTKKVVGKAKEALIEEVLYKNPLLALFLRKNLDLGFGVTSAKDLGIIASHSPQKGVLLTDYSKVQYPIIADFKYNGSRLSVIVKGGKATCTLLKGNVISIPLLETILSEFEGCTFDGEIVYTDNTPAGLLGGITETDRIEVSGRITSATACNVSMSMQGLSFIVYDILDSDKFTSSIKTTKPYHTRRKELVECNIPDTRYVKLSQLWQVANSDELKALVDWNKEIGGEGFMLKGINSTYDYKKNNQWLKIKHFKELDLKIINYKVHSRRDDWIGSLLCYGIVDNKQVLVNVGSGLNDGDRSISKFSEYKDKIVMVTYMDIVSNKSNKGVYSLTNPRFAKDVVARPLVEILRLDGSNING